MVIEPDPINILALESALSPLSVNIPVVNSLVEIDSAAPRAVNRDPDPDSANVL